MKQSELVVGKAYTNGSESKWYQERTITVIDGSTVLYKTTGGREEGREGSMTKVGFAQWAKKEAVARYE